MSVDTDTMEGRGASPGALYRYSRRAVMTVIAVQIAAALSVSGALALTLGITMAYSTLVGAGVGILPNYYLAVRMFRRGTARNTEQVLRGIYLGEGIKILFTVALFVTALLVLEVDIAMLLAGYLVVIGVHWGAMLFCDLSETRC